MSLGGSCVVDAAASDNKVEGEGAKVGLAEW